MNSKELGQRALDMLDCSEVLHEFEDSITLRIDRDAWEYFLAAGKEQDDDQQKQH